MIKDRLPDKMSATRNGNSTKNPNGSSLSPKAPSTPLHFDSLSRASGSEFSLSLGAGETEISPEKFAKLVAEYGKV